MDLYLFDFDKTLYGYDFMKRLPALARATGASQYDLASTWWADGYEARAEAGEWPDSTSYLERFEEVTGARLELADWQDARAAAMTPIESTIAALRRASSLGTVSLFSNNPAIFAESLHRLAPEVAQILGANIVTSCLLRVRKPAPESYQRILAHFGVSAADTFYVDDSAANAVGGREAGMHTHHFTGPAGSTALDEAITAFAARKE